MPECQECGNRREFRHEVEGEELRQYHPETGDLKGIEKVRGETMCVVCARCESTHVEINL